jgi:GPI-anchor transamidase subunit GAA1
LLEDLRYESKKYDTTLPYPWLEARFRQLGLEVYTHDFTLKFPLGPENKKSNFTGKNVYGKKD